MVVEASREVYWCNLSRELRMEVTPAEKSEGEQERHSLASRHQPQGQDIEPDSRSSIDDLRMLH